MIYRKASKTEYKNSVITYKLMKQFSFLTFFVILLSPYIYGGIRPSFSVEYSAWFATDIVLVTEGEMIDGQVKILETIKGDTLPNQEISIPELKEFSSASSRQVKQWYSGENVVPEQFVTNSKMILFLKRSPNSLNSWKPADFYNNFPTSIFWIEETKTFAFIQTINPGASTLVEYGSETDIRDSVRKIIDIQTAINKVSKIRNKSNRAKELVGFIQSDYFQADKKIFQELEKCGVSAIPVLNNSLNNDSLVEFHPDFIETWAKIGGQKIRRKLVKIVTDELAFWKATVPKLNKEWWNSTDNPRREIYRNHYGKVISAIRQLEKLKYKKSKRAVIRFRDFWKSQSVLNSDAGLSQIVDECNELLKEIKFKKRKQYKFKTF